MIFVKQSKQIYKTSNNGDVKSVAAKYCKTASDLLKTYGKPMEKSHIITQQLDTVKKPKHFGHRISYYRTPEN